MNDGDDDDDDDDSDSDGGYCDDDDDDDDDEDAAGDDGDDGGDGECAMNMRNSYDDVGDEVENSNVRVCIFITHILTAHNCVLIGANLIICIGIINRIRIVIISSTRTTTPSPSIPIITHIH